LNTGNAAFTALMTARVEACVSSLVCRLCAGHRHGRKPSRCRFRSPLRQCREDRRGKNMGCSVNGQADTFSTDANFKTNAGQIADLKCISPIYGFEKQVVEPDSR
jgi:hypothetical protein